MAILGNLKRLKKEQELLEVLTLVFVRDRQRELPTWEEVLQVEAGNGLLAALQLSVLPASVLPTLLSVSLTLLSTWSTQVHEVWLQVVNAAIDTLPVSTVLSLAGRVGVQLGDSSQTVATRLVACKLLGTLARRVGSEFRGEILQKSLFLAQDTSYEVRKCMCAEMQHIFRAVGEDTRSKVFHEVMKLVEDEEIEVRREALPLLIHVVDLLSSTTVQNHVLPLLTDEILPSSDPETRLKLTVCCGEIALKFASQFQSAAFRQHYISFFQSLAGSDIEQERLSAAFNFPAIISALGPVIFDEDLKGSYISLCRDSNLTVRTVMAKSYHEVIRLVADKIEGLSIVFQEFFSEEKLQEIVIRNLGKIVEMLSGELDASQLLSLIAGVLRQNRPWRVLSTVLEETTTILDQFLLPDLIETLQPVLLSLLPQVCIPLKSAITRSLAKLISINYLSNHRNDLCCSLVSLLGNSQQYQCRITYIQCCVESLQLVSRRLFKQYFWTTLVRLMHDPVVNVRLKAAQNLVFFHSVFCTDEELQQELTDVISRLQEDADAEVARLAADVQVKIASRDYWTAVRAFETADIDRMKREEMQVQMEVREREEAKKKLVQDLTEKARMEYLQQYKDRRTGGKTKPGKPLNPSRAIVINLKVDSKPVALSSPKFTSAKAKKK